MAVLGLMIYKLLIIGAMSMETIKCITERRSIRNFTDEQIEDSVLEKIISTASYAPSWKNTQITRYTIIKSREIIDRIAKEGVLDFVGNTKNITACKELVVLSYKNGRCGYERDGSFSTSKGDRWQMFDVGIAAQTFCLAAWDNGIGSVIMGIFDDEMVAKEINLPEDETVAVLIAIGYPAVNPIAPKRKSTEQLMRIM